MSIMNLLWPIVAGMDVVRTAMSLAIRKLAEGTLGLPNKQELPSETAICFRRRSLSRVANSPMNNVCTTTVAAEPEVSQKMHLEYLLPDSGSFRKPFIYRPKKIDKSYWPVVIYTTTQWKCVQITTYLREHRTWRKWRKCTGSWRNEGFVVNALNVNRHAHYPLSVLHLPEIATQNILMDPDHFLGSGSDFFPFIYILVLTFHIFIRGVIPCMLKIGCHHRLKSIKRNSVKFSRLIQNIFLRSAN